ncbi:MAG: hypothetical protein IIC94_08750 [Chloroflexi bacterium]|nr:hypothetical protein [Chloroflexota bacterium]
MAKIVLGIGTSHSPMLSTPAEKWPEHVKRDLANRNLWAWDGKPHTYEEMVEMSPSSIAGELTMDVWRERDAANQAAIAKLGDVIADVDPDVIVMVGDDQHELIHEDNMPALLVYWGEKLPNKPRDRTRMPPSIAMAAWGNEFDEEVELDGQADLGLHIIESVIADEFDVAHSKELPEGRGEGHAFGFVHRRVLDGKRIPPTVPILQNTYYPPTQPLPKRCYAFGKAIRRAIESWESDARVAVLASGGLSHFVIDEKLDRGVLKALEDHDADHLTTLPVELLNSGNSEIRNWITVGAMVEGMDMTLVNYIPCYRSPASTGCAMAFAYWE